ncbi:MAG: enoyl-CoA hydratase/isomerase family protein [Rhizobiaceae bacterium]
MTESLSFAMDGPLARITLNRPDKMNAVNGAMLEALLKALDEVRSCGAAMLVIDGAGRNFCAGADLGEVRGIEDQSERRAFQAMFQQVVRNLWESDCWTVARVRGVAFAGGFELVLACDEAICSADARFGDAHMRYALIPGAGGTVLLPTVMGFRRAKRLIACAETLSAQEAQESGLVTELLDPEEMEAWITRRANYFSTRTQGLAQIKTLMRAAIEPVAGEQPWLRELDAICRHLSSAQARDGLAKFAERKH